MWTKYSSCDRDHHRRPKETNEEGDTLETEPPLDLSPSNYEVTKVGHYGFVSEWIFTLDTSHSVRDRRSDVSGL